MVHNYILLLHPASHEKRIHQARQDQGQDAGARAVEGRGQLDEVESLPGEVWKHTQEIVEESVAFADMVQASLFIYEESESKIYLIWEIQCCESSVANETLEDSFHVKICG